VSEIADALNVEIVIASQHPGVLYTLGVMERQKQGRLSCTGCERASSRPERARGKQHIDLGCCRLEIP
jgi:hypothetical protein